MSTGITLSEFRVTGWYVPEHGGATYPCLICPRCGDELLEADEHPDLLKRLQGWGTTMALDDVIAAAQKHRYAHEY